MKATIISVIAIIFLLFGYVIGVNMISSGVDSPGGFIKSNISGGVTDVPLGFGESTSISTISERWYGVVKTEYGSTQTSSYLYVFNTVKLPWKTSSFEWIYIHLLFMFIAFFIIVACFIYDITKKPTERRLTTQNAQSY